MTVFFFGICFVICFSICLGNGIGIRAQLLGGGAGAIQVRFSATRTVQNEQSFPFKLKKKTFLKPDFFYSDKKGKRYFS